MQCPNCNNTVPDTANVCGYCGTRLRAPAPPAAPIQPPPQPVSPPTGSPPPMQYSPAPAPVSRAMPPVETAPRPKSRATAIVIGLIVVACVLVVAAAAVWAIFFSDINLTYGSASPTIVASEAPVEVIPVPQQPPMEATPFQQSPTPTSIQETTYRVSVEPLGPENRGDIPSVGSLKNEQNILNISANQAVFIFWGWCATTPEILQQNMEHITISYIFNNEILPFSQFYKSDTKNSDGQFCINYSGVIRSWPVGQHTLEYLMTSDATVNDGVSEYKKGEIAHRTYTINVSP